MYNLSVYNEYSTTNSVLHAVLRQIDQLRPIRPAKKKASKKGKVKR